MHAFDQEVVPESLGKFGKGKGIDECVANSSDAKVFNFGEDKFKERSSSNDMEFWQVFIEVAQRRNRSRAELDFVEEKKCFARHDFLADDSFKQSQNPV